MEITEEHIEKMMAERNTVTEMEFVTFQKLYSKEDRDSLTQEEFNRLTINFQKRFSLRHPIIVVEDRKNAEGNAIVKMVLPAILNSMKTLNDCDSVSLTDIFHNRSERSLQNPLDFGHMETGDQIVGTLAALTIVDKEAQREYNKIANNFEIETDSRHDPYKDTEWEEL